MYKKVDTNLNFLEREKEIIKFWEDNHVFEESVKKNEGHPEFWLGYARAPRRTRNREKTRA